jgi:hypothetical protein
VVDPLTLRIFRFHPCPSLTFFLNREVNAERKDHNVGLFSRRFGFLLPPWQWQQYSRARDTGCLAVGVERTHATDDGHDAVIGVIDTRVALPSEGVGSGERCRVRENGWE